jgi:predicted enzyme related to lactoylglutathione lyase
MPRERQDYPAGVPCWLDTAQPDPEAAAAFYGGLFGWDFTDRTPAGATGRLLVGQVRGRDVAGVASAPAADGGPPAWTTYVAVEDADEAAARAVAAGGTVLLGPADVADAGRVAVLADLEGAVVGAWEARGRIGAELVNEPGTWNFSGLTTRDPEGAAAFYGAVFGWEATSVPAEEGGFTMFRMPGYGAYLEERDPGLRERLGADSAPKGFEDAVAWLEPMDGGHPPEAAPHWGVTFSVDDADAVAERVEALGGTVLVPPVDAPWIRMTVIRDPQGAVFTATKYVPPSASATTSSPDEARSS